MSQFDTTLQNLPTIVKYALVLGVVVFISTLFPNHNQLSYTFLEGEVWEKEDLYAPVDFQIKLTEEELDSIKTGLNEQTVIYFSIEKRIRVLMKYVNRR